MSKFKRALLGVGAAVGALAFGVGMTALTHYLSGSVAGQVIQAIAFLAIVVCIGVNTYHASGDDQGKS